MVTPVPLTPIIWIACPPVVAFSIAPKKNLPAGVIRLRVPVRLTPLVTFRLVADHSGFTMVWFASLANTSVPLFSTGNGPAGPMLPVNGTCGATIWPCRHRAVRQNAAASVKAMTASFVCVSSRIGNLPTNN